jgi:hypothetical protein
MFSSARLSSRSAATGSSSLCSRSCLRDMKGDSTFGVDVISIMSAEHPSDLQASGKFAKPTYTLTISGKLIALEIDASRI